jgi:U-box domain-containing protein
MSEISFFTPIYYGSRARSSKDINIQNIDNYFYIYGKKAVVIDPTHSEGEKVIFQHSKFSGWDFLKLIGIALSYFTVVIPLGLLISKAVLRSSKKYTLMQPNQRSISPIGENRRSHTPEKIVPVTKPSDAVKNNVIKVEPPENYLDPISFEIMSDPFRTPMDHSSHVYDYSTLKSLTSNDTGEFEDPQTRKIYKLSDCKPDLKLKAEIQEWKKANAHTNDIST